MPRPSKARQRIDQSQVFRQVGESRLNTRQKPGLRVVGVASIATVKILLIISAAARLSPATFFHTPLGRR